MNKDIIQGTWKEIKGGLRETWGRLTENNAVESYGREERLLGKLKKMCGYLSEAEQEYEKFLAASGKDAVFTGK